MLTSSTLPLSVRSCVPLTEFDKLIFGGSCVLPVLLITHEE